MFGNSNDTFLLIVGDSGQSGVPELLSLREAYPHRVIIEQKYSFELARDVVSGSDILLMPSRYEPCGLTQLIAMRFGTLPIVRRTGGLADTVIDGETGFTFGPPTATALHDTILRYLGSEQRWDNMRRQAMKADYSWTSSARRYIQLYEEVHAGE